MLITVVSSPQPNKLKQNLTDHTPMQCKSFAKFKDINMVAKESTTTVSFKYYSKQYTVFFKLNLKKLK